MFPMSSAVCASPTPRTVYRSDRCSMKPPPNDALLSAIAWNTSCSVRPKRLSCRGSTTTWNCCVSPPQELISLTPGTERSRVRMSQSCSVFFVIASTASPSSRYW